MFVTNPFFWQSLASALTLGCLYALIAIGYTMVYGILRLINFAHGDIFMMALYFLFYSIAIFAIPWYIAVIVSVILTGVLGMLTERLAYRPLRTQGAPKISMLISAIGMSYLLENLATVLFGGRPKAFPQIPLLTDTITIGSIRLQRLALIVPLIMIVLVAALLYLIQRTKTGMAMRAASKDVETARLMGIDVNTTIAVTFLIGSTLASVGAFMWGLAYPQIIPTIGVMPGMKCFIAAVVGGIGNVKGAVIGAIVIGLMEIMLVYFLSDLTGYRDAFAFVLLIIILLVRPTGILGEKIAEKV